MLFLSPMTLKKVVTAFSWMMIHGNSIARSKLVDVAISQAGQGRAAQSKYEKARDYRTHCSPRSKRMLSSSLAVWGTSEC